MTADEPAITRPRTRADCVRGPRPCPWISCRHHLAEPRINERGRLYLNVLSDSLGVDADAATVDAFIDAASDALLDMAETCALDVVEADPDGVTLEVTGGALAVTRERCRQLEGKALASAKRACRRARVEP